MLLTPPISSVALLSSKPRCQSPPSPAGDPVHLCDMIKLIDVYKSFGDKKVLEGFSLEVEEGETMALIGYSGTGKSVAIKHIVGLLDPDRGTVWVDGQEVPKLSRVELYALRSH